MKVHLSSKALSHPFLLVFRLQPRLNLKEISQQTRRFIIQPHEAQNIVMATVGRRSECTGKTSTVRAVIVEIML